MSSIPLQIVLHGLIALVPMNDTNGANHMTALLVDARSAPNGMDLPCFAPHIPMLEVTVQDTAACKAAGCEVKNTDRCHCILSRQDIALSIDPPLTLGKKRLKQKPKSSIPIDLSNADDFSYILNLSQQPGGWILDPKFLSPSPPGALVARMTFPFEDVKACALGARYEEEVEYVHSANLRGHGVPEKAQSPHQAVAQQAVALLEVPEQATVKVTLSTFCGAGQDLILKPGKFIEEGAEKTIYSIDLSNMRSEEVEVDDPCDDGIGRDFAFFYELVQKKVDWKKRPIPHVKYSLRGKADDLKTQACTRRTLNPSSRPICPMGSFNTFEVSADE